MNLFKAEQKRLKGKKLVAYKQTLKLTPIQREVIIGTLLGDATMPKQLNRGAYNLKFEQTFRQESYIWHLYELFEPLVGTPPKVRNISGGGARGRKSIWFRTYRHIVFQFYYDFFYPVDLHNLSQRKKKVPKTIHKVLTARALAYWFMDDGASNKGKNYYYFNTQGFYYFDICILKKALKKNFNLDTNIYRDRTFYLLYIQSQSNSAFVKLIQPYLLESFQYKIFTDNVLDLKNKIEM
jgi:hypothetical protein